MRTTPIPTVVVLIALSAIVAGAWDVNWVDQFGNGVSAASAGGVKTDSTGVYVAGEVLGALPGHERAGSYDAFVRKYNFDGSLAWTRQFGSPFAEFVRGTATDPTGVYVAGQTDGALPGQNNSGRNDVFIRKYS